MTRKDPHRPLFAMRGAALVALGRLALLGIASVLTSGCGDDTTGPYSHGFFLVSAHEIVTERVQLRAFLDGHVTSDVTYDVQGGAAHGRVGSDGLYVAPDSLPNPPEALVTARLRSAPAREATALLHLETCGWDVGKIPCPLVGRDSLDQPQALDFYRGYVVLVAFTASWCGPCRIQAATSEAVYQQLKAELPVRFVSVDVLLDQPTNPAGWWATAYGLTYPVWSVTGEDYAAARLSIKGIPTSVVITPDYRIRSRITGLRTDSLLVQTVRDAWAAYRAER